MDTYDVVIIGAGLGGLVAGAKLSREGKKVILFEQHNIPGGCATTFRRKGFKMEVGLNAMGGLDSDDVKQIIFKELGIMDKVKFLRLPEFYKYMTEDKDYVVPDDATDAIEMLTREFPEEAGGIRKFFRCILNVRKEMNRYCALHPRFHKPVLFIMPFVYPNIVLNMFKTVGRFLDQCFKNERLKALLVANMSYYHDDPYSMSLLYFSAAQGEYYKGAYFIQGGSQALSDHLAKTIITHGGTIKYNHLVTRILIEKSAAAGVEYCNKKDPKKILLARAGSIVANAAIPYVAEQLLPHPEAEKILRKTRNLSKSCSFFIVFLQFKRPVKTLGNDHYTLFINTQKRFTIDQWCALQQKEYSGRPFYFCDYSQLDAHLTPAGKGQGVICCTDYLKNWENLSPDEYKQKKQMAAEALIERLNTAVPGIKKEIEYFEASTPKTIKRYIQTPEGAVYGFAQTVRQAVPYRLSTKSPVRNLYFASSWAFPGGGFTGAIISGYTCARIIGK